MAAPSLAEPLVNLRESPSTPPRSTIESRYDANIVPLVRRGLTLTHGKGSYVWDDKGRRYLDFGGGIAVNSLGHAHPALVETLAGQGGKLMHCSNLYYHEEAAHLAEQLVDLTGPGKVFFCNSGAEANEGLIKLARKHGQAEGRFEIITARDSFHGRTMAAISATGQEKIQHGFAPLLEGFVHVPYNDLAAVEGAITSRTVALLVEVIQGEGGVNMATPEYLLGLRALADRHGLLLLLDGVQDGCFRTGRWQAYERLLENSSHPAAAGFMPDAIGMAKSLGGGFPLGAVWIREPYQEVLGTGSHGSTFGGSPLACAMGRTVLDVIEREGLADNIRARGDELLFGLADLAEGPGIKSARGFGGLIGLELVEDVAQVAARLTKAGLLLIPAANQVLRFLPPLNVSSSEVQEALQIVRDSL